MKKILKKNLLKSVRIVYLVSVVANPILERAFRTEIKRDEKTSFSHTLQTLIGRRRHSLHPSATLDGRRIRQIVIVFPNG